MHNPANYEASVSNTDPSAPPAEDSYTNSIQDVQELYDIIKQMRNNASPGPDDLNAAFYKSAWPWIKRDVAKLVIDFYSSGHFNEEINKTYIALIPKKTNPKLRKILGLLIFVMSFTK
jgi:hypothetical protein